MLKVRPMETRDIDRVHAIENSSHILPWSRDILSDCVLVGFQCLVLEETSFSSSQIVGYIICRHNLDVCHILNLCIDVPYQGKGFGRFLLQELINSLKNNELQWMLLEVRPSNQAALALYKRFGFEKKGIKKGYYKGENGQDEDALVLTRGIYSSSC